MKKLLNVSLFIILKLLLLVCSKVNIVQGIQISAEAYKSKITLDFTYNGNNK